MWITNNQQNIVVNFHQDFVASICQGETQWGRIYWPNHSGKTRQSKQEGVEAFFVITVVLSPVF
jgi:hypothetical protein